MISGTRTSPAATSPAISHASAPAHATRPPLLRRQIAVRIQLLKGQIARLDPAITADPAFSRRTEILASIPGLVT